MKISTSKAMTIFTDGSSQKDIDLTVSGLVIKNQGLNSTPVKITNTVTEIGSRYKEELEAMYLVAAYAKDNIWDKVFKNGPSKICGRQPLKI